MELSQSPKLLLRQPIQPLERYQLRIWLSKWKLRLLWQKECYPLETKLLPKHNPKKRKHQCLEVKVPKHQTALTIPIPLEWNIPLMWLIWMPETMNLPKVSPLPRKLRINSFQLKSLHRKNHHQPERFLPNLSSIHWGISSHRRILWWTSMQVRAALTSKI